MPASRTRVTAAVAVVAAVARGAAPASAGPAYDAADATLLGPVIGSSGGDRADPWH